MYSFVAADSVVSMAIVSIAFSTLVNIILALLIVLRITHHQRHIRKVLKVDPTVKLSTYCTISIDSDSHLYMLVSCINTGIVPTYFIHVYGEFPTSQKKTKL